MSNVYRVELMRARQCRLDASTCMVHDARYLRGHAGLIPTSMTLPVAAKKLGFSLMQEDGSLQIAFTSSCPATACLLAVSKRFASSSDGVKHSCSQARHWNQFTLVLDTRSSITWIGANKAYEQTTMSHNTGDQFYLRLLSSYFLQR
ncbi:hypothetical protein F4604DRAFT_1685734 [Suillus subluteus]|nr:hypothetical protein F4604DRAFT_1685734 [Suillus subluteus]